MCGIVGLYSFDQEERIDPALVSGMCGDIRHRGPDDEGIFVEGGIGCGMRRLSIIDLSTGHQPVFNEDRSLAIVFNGEIYNYRELRHELEAKGHVFATKSDTETVIHAFEEYGHECVRRLNGMFAFAIVDRRKRTLFIARDHFGIKPLYYVQTPQTLIFASEIKAILRNREVTRSVDSGGLAEYMNFGYVSGDRTLFEGIRKLPAGHFMTIGPRGVNVRAYWSLPDAPEPGRDLGLSHYAELLRDTLRTAVKRQLVSDVPLGAFLSGGMDSSSIVHMMREVGSGDVRTYAIGFGSQHQFHDELADARLVARHEQTDHHEIIAAPHIVDLLPRLVWHLDEPVADSSYIVTYLVSQLASQSVKVILSGVGGDELFGGYRRYLGYTLNRYAAAVPKGVRRGVHRALAHLPTSRDNAVGNITRLARSFIGSLDAADQQYASLLRVFGHDVLAGGGLAPTAQATFASRVFSKELGHGDLLQQMQRYDCRHSLVDDLLLLTDKMTMACSLESRVPLLDLDLVELAATIPSKYKVSGMGLRRVQMAAMEGVLPEAILKKKKRGFGCPVGAWVKSELRDYIGDSLSASRLSRHGLFEPRVVASTLADHYAGRADHTDQLMSLLTFEIWYDTFIDRPVAVAA